MSMSLIAKSILADHYPEYEKNSPLPPDVLCLCLGFLITEEHNYYPNGTLRTRTLEHGKYREMWTWYERDALKSPRLVEHGIFVHGKEHGEFKRYYETGQMYERGPCVNGKKHGVWRELRGPKHTWMMARYVNGRVVGRWNAVK